MALRSTQEWLDEYGESHQNPVNKAVHWICVPLIALTVIGLLWSLPVPAAFLEISPKLAFGMLFVIAAFAAILQWLDGFETPLWIISIAVFVLAWIGQFIGHIAEGKRPSFFKDLQFLMIGPMWLLSFIYQRLGIRY